LPEALMKSLVCALIVLGLAVAAAAQSGNQKFQGHLVDTVCAVGHATEAGYAENHDRNCNLMEGCIKSGYSLDYVGTGTAVVINQGVEKNKFSGGEAASA
jgi:hypothetical protein